MIDFERLLDNKEKYRLEYLTNQPFPYLVLDGICDQNKLVELYDSIPELENKSRDYAFANNKFEKSNYKALGPLFEELYHDLASDQMNEFLSFICSEEVFVDPKNFGGGLHQGKKNSFLDMHADFNYHPVNKMWFRNLNLLLYLNKGWKEEYGGHLKLLDARTGKSDAVGVPFNRLIIQQTRTWTLHGYDLTSFPPGNYRTSIATYAYTKHNIHIEKPRTTDWKPKDSASTGKKMFAKYYNFLVQTKNKFFGIGTLKNQ